MKIQQQQQSPFVYYNTQNPLQKRSRVTCVTRTRVVQNGHRTAAPLVLSARARVRYGNARGDFPARPGLRSLSERERKMNNKNSKKSPWSPHGGASAFREIAGVAMVTRRRRRGVIVTVSVELRQREVPAVIVAAAIGRRRRRSHRRRCRRG